MDRKLATDIGAALLMAELDERCAGYPIDVLRAVERLCRKFWDADDAMRHGDLTLNEVCEWATLMHKIPRPWVFYSVALLEDLGYLPKGAIR